MKIMHAFLLLGVGVTASACGTVGIPTRNSPYEQIPDSEVQAPEGYEAAPSASLIPPVAPTGIRAEQAPVSVNSVVVRVPRDLKVSEANRYIPRSDIVWREDPIGDRHAQVQKIFEDAVAKGVAPLDGPAKVDLDVEVLRFHALTEKARYTTGGVHSITFTLTIKDAETGEVLVPARTIRADLDGFGGQQALRAEAKGQTQKVRISDHLAEVVRQELSNPEGYENAKLGFFQLLNNI